MVESNNNTNENPAPKKRALFGGRRSRSRATTESVAAAAAANAPAETATSRGEGVISAPPVEAPTPEATAVETPAAEAVTPSAVAAPAADETPMQSADAVAEPEAAQPAVEDDEPAAAEPTSPIPAVLTTTSLIFHAPPVLVTPDRPERPERSERSDRSHSPAGDDEGSSARRRTRRRSGEDARANGDEPQNTVVKVRQPREPELITEPQRVKGSTRLEAKKQRRRDGRDAGRRRAVITEAEFLARRESVDRSMIVRQKQGRIQIGVLEDGVLVEHYVARNQEASLIGNVYLGRVQNVLPSMEAAFVDIGRGRNAVLYSGEVDWEAAAEAGQPNQPRRIELALKPGDKVLVQVTKDPVGHKGARLTSQVSLPGRYLVYVPNGSMNGISRKLPDTERARLKKILKEVLPENVGVIVRTAAEGATEEQLTLDVTRLTSQWADISKKVESMQAPALLHSEPDLLIKIVRDVFNEDFQRMVISGGEARETITSYLQGVAPDLVERVEEYSGDRDAFDEFRISEQIEKALDRKVWLPSGGSLVIDRTEAMTVVDVNTGKFVGSGGNLEETVTKNNLEAAEEIVRQLRLRDIGGIIVVDFIDMVLESNRDLVLRRLVECLSRDRTKHQVAEVTSLGLVQMTRKKLGLGLLESYSESCETCAGRGIIVHHDPIAKHRPAPQTERRRGRGAGNGGGASNGSSNGNAPAANVDSSKPSVGTHGITEDAKNALAAIAASTLAHDAKADSAEAVEAAATEAPTAESTTSTDDAPQREPGSRSRRGRKGRRSSNSTPAESNDDASAPESAPPASSAPVIELPEVAPAVEKPVRRRAPDAENLLDSVLEALPAPKQPGEGRASRSRRVSTAAVVGNASDPVITRHDV
ncbi:Rne/Rng family ribonuclease [Agromyces atrinae]|uniref:Rne/Rng family ribonuclease n=1 Tax=Agromyces atrinae TaxID=592376 RepID=UPI001F57126D|nr:Rne/Rng family ribonuclease [Agromyces atrinae]MCI2958581.1 Rne/Rng family ribonuclease [Agromyces atrinae]